MNKFVATAAVGFMLATGAASAQTTTIVQPARPATVQSSANGSYRLANLRNQHAFGVHTTSALSRNIGPDSTVDGYRDTPLASPNSGMPQVAGAPGASNVAGGN